MDSFGSAVKYLFMFLPVEMVCKVVEKMGIIYGVLIEYPFQKGKRKAQRVYKRLEK